MVTSTPDATASKRGAFIVRNPTRSPSHTRGRNKGPWLENTSRNGHSPARMASAETPKTPSSNTRERDANSAGSRRRSATAASAAASIRQFR